VNLELHLRADPQRYFREKVESGKFWNAGQIINAGRATWDAEDLKARILRAVNEEHRFNQAS
jgi:hypothetical protein